MSSEHHYCDYTFDGQDDFGPAKIAEEPQPDPARILQRAMDYIAAQYGGTLAHHILAKAKKEL